VSTAPGGERCRFAPTTSGAAHPGTLLAALLCWLDARSRGARLTLRLEDVDHTRCTPERAEQMRAALAWLGLDWDDCELQSAQRPAHEAALARLAAAGRLYACLCSRAELARAGRRSADGGWVYPGTCRERRVGPAELAGVAGALRLRLEPGRLELRDESGLDLGQDAALELGDPVLRRRDGAIAYHLAAVVDDARAGITRVVRGRDLASATATQVQLQRALGVATPAYRHHLLLLEPRGRKLAKLHGAVGWPQLRGAYEAAQLCGWLACAAGLRERPVAARPRELLAGFDWSRVRQLDQAVRWTGRELQLL
jgi:glutamyl-tRNA synthetase/glutamyl-Q tRNA(Asp) synthetase